MTEDQIERIVERRVDGIDRRYLSTGMTEAEYDAELKTVFRWATEQYRAMERQPT